MQLQEGLMPYKQPPLIHPFVFFGWSVRPSVRPPVNEENWLLVWHDKWLSFGQLVEEEGTNTFGLIYIHKKLFGGSIPFLDAFLHIQKWLICWDVYRAFVNVGSQSSVWKIHLRNISFERSCESWKMMRLNLAIFILNQICHFLEVGGKTIRGRHFRVQF